MSRIIRTAPGLGRGGLLGNTEGPEAYLRALDTLPSQFCRATGGTETVLNQSGRYYRVHTYTDTDPTSLLLNFDGSNGSTTFTDDSGWGHAVTANGDAQISTAQSVFGGSSLALDGTGDYLSVPDSSQFEFGSGDFTIECWFYIAGNSAQNNSGNRVADLVAKFPSSGNIFGIEFRVNGDSTTTGTGVSFFAYNNSSELFSATYSGTVTQSAWHHAAVCRSGSNLYLFLDGSQVQLTTGISGSIPDTAYSLLIGKSAYTNFEHSLNGYIDSLRITKGQALYTSAFTPPTQALTRVGSGSLTFSRGGAVEYLVVGGGGGGGGVNTVSGRGNGGGGAGGFRNGVTVAVATETLVSVGGGGSGGVASTSGQSGSSSSLLSVESAGGGDSGSSGGSGGGGFSNNSPGTPGGSGNTPAVTPSQGNDGGLGISSGGNGGGGGGGGASTVGADAVISPSSAGDGGDGTASTISGSSVTYAGGGGGGSGSSTGGGAGGSGGGGSGGNTSSKNGTSGTANTGGGGGGASSLSNVYGTAGSGGSGIVIVRYQITQAEYEAEAA